MGARTVVLGYARTPFGRFLGALKDIAAVDLGALVLKEALRRAKVEPAAAAEPTAWPPSAAARRKAEAVVVEVR